MSIAKALLAFQADAPALQRDKINPHLKSKYLSLEALLEDVLPVLNHHGIVLTQWPTFIETETGTRPALRTRIEHAESGDFLEETMLLLPAKEAPQEQGAAITYAKRYALMAALGLSADTDDDAQVKQPSRQRKAPGKISAKQRQDLMAAIREKRLPTDRAQEIVKEVAGVDASEDIPAGMFAGVLRAIRAAK